MPEPDVQAAVKLIRGAIALLDRALAAGKYAEDVIASAQAELDNALAKLGAANPPFKPYPPDDVMREHYHPRHHPPE